VEQSKIDRINELARKMKSEGLTECEKEEQAKLRKEYLDSVRKSFRQTLESIEYTD
jgi:uncharacterized protein YnzC (UPF0291/DUF896 family)